MQIEWEFWQWTLYRHCGSCVSGDSSPVAEKPLNTYRAPILIPARTPIRSFLLRVSVLMSCHGRVARTMSIAPDQAVPNKQLAGELVKAHGLLEIFPSEVRELGESTYQTRKYCSRSEFVSASKSLVWKSAIAFLQDCTVYM